MEGEGSNKNAVSIIQNCNICNMKPRSYTCPRCGIGYCTVECYKSESHLDCSESFYKECVEEEFKSQGNDPETRKKMLEILQRVNEEDPSNYFDLDDINEDAKSDLDSDDEDTVPDLATRLQNVDLDNADEIWHVLTSAERQEFDAMVKNGEAEKLLPKWVPWWTSPSKKKLIQELDNSDSVESNEKLCPKVLEVPELNVTKAATTVKYNLMNVIYSYAYIALYYNGDYFSCPEDATVDFLAICRNLSDNELFDNEEAACVSVVNNIKKCDWLPWDDQNFFAMKESANLILYMPEEKLNSLYISAALSELHRLFSATKERLFKSNKVSANSGKFGDKFTRKTDASRVNLNKKALFLYSKKLEYYISWAKAHSVDTVIS